MSPPDDRRDGGGRPDREAHDPAEIWGRRIGRGLGVAALVVLGYLLGRQLHLW